MQTAILGPSSIPVSALGLATGVLRSDHDVWEPGDENELIAAVHLALECGITLIDTAPTHGGGLAEELVGKAIIGRREAVVLATKCGLKPHGDGRKGYARCLTPESIHRECEASLRRLRVETIDLYQCHWPDPDTPIAETLGSLDRLVEQGKIRACGLVNFGLSRLAQAREHGTICTLQVPFSLLNRDYNDDLIPYCHKIGVAVLASDPLAGGRLDDEDASATASVSPERDPTRRTRLSALAAERNCSLSQLAITWAAGHPGITATPVPACRPSKVRDAVDAVRRDLTEAERTRIDEILDVAP